MRESVFKKVRLIYQILSPSNNLCPSDTLIRHERGHIGDSNESEELVCSKWYTRLKLDEGKTFPSRAESEGAEEQFRVNENYRDTLSRKLRPKYLEDAKLSVEYLNLCLRLYFNRFHPILPLIHVPTFRSNSQNALLFLSMCSIGSLFIGSADAAAQGHRIFSRLNKAILASWETHLSTNKREALSMVQAAVLGQTFGLLSGRPSDLVMVDAFHGTLFAWARKVGAFENQELRMPIVDMGSEELDKTWKEWIYAEQLARLAVVLYIHDAEMGNLFHHDSFARLTLIKYSTVLDVAKAQANRTRKTVNISLQKWAFGDADHIQILTSLMSQSELSAYGILENINALILESRQAESLGGERTRQLNDDLIRWYRVRFRTSQMRAPDPFSLQVLWHSCFMCLYSDYDMLEQAIGRDGLASAKTCSTRHIEGMRLNTTPAIHVPRAIFLSGLTWICFSRFSTKQNFPEIDLVTNLGEQNLLEIKEMLAQMASQEYPALIYDIIDVLRKIGRWGISEAFANILIDALRGAIEV
ncbi:hypothetical protein AOQ84DRAFT_429588 [Glonium stellatum]|uniref:Xylanolytic transcriptional activator regulatory domain-containing protein n=1 Tax=Glonium stellatum TaxID=574774 RepID=A0A8E2F9E9_9PEZI|nr:hypothetical protein AOQ84DRAFT_429588 [Glonium stellatum]